MSLRTAATKRTENLKAILYVFADCNDCCLLSVGDLKVNVSKGRMSLRTAMVVSSDEHKRKSKSKIVCLCGLQ